MAVSAISSNLLTTSLISGGVTGTWGAVSQGIINKNFGIKNGDKLTFIFVGQSSLGDYLPAFSYVILDTSSTDSAASVIEASNLSFTGVSDANLQVGVLNTVSNIVAGAVIVSRLVESSGTTWQRSDSVMFCTSAYKESMMGAAAYQASIQSYTSQENYESDWYLNQGIVGNPLVIGGGNSGSNLTVVSRENIRVTFAGGIGERDIAVATMSDGTKRAYRSNANPSKLMYLNGVSIISYTSDVYLANAENLTLISGVDNLVTGYIVTNASDAEGNEQPE